MATKTIELYFSRPQGNSSLLFTHCGKYGSASMCLYGIKEFFDISTRDFALRFTIHGSKPPGNRWHRIVKEGMGDLGGWFLADVQSSYSALPSSIDSILDKAFPKRRTLYVSLIA